MTTPITFVAAVPSSPAMSFSSSSSFDMVQSSRSRSSSFELYLDDSDDEIVWSVTEDESISPVAAAADDDDDEEDFVVLGRRQPFNDTSTPTNTDKPDDHHLISALAQLSVEEARRNNTKLPAVAVAVSSAAVVSTTKPKVAQTTPPPKSPKVKGASSSPQSQSPPLTPTLKSSRRKRNKNKNKAVGGFSSRPIVDDISERGDSVSVSDEGYQAAASRYINSFLVDQTSVCRLTLLQSLLIELGLCSASLLPASLTAAKAMLKSHAFLNVREYLDARQQGPAAVQNVMHPSKASLIRDLRKKRNPVPLKWVKETGLGVLLVTCYH
ncbi:hypothetical protein FB45DRAFT_1026615 [Roridomyces roridus]|uniref:Uncharacterized protein n=1 Tax=Roridomyces roridus TaxID=1738132 RepID=A0AAD7BXI0_9AGAR|nr:hypothetical protein FB45DRAFT_1026615 [Roridomyces roridus]